MWDVNQLITEAWRVHGSIYRDQSIFDEELRTIFGTCWLYVGHDSELKNPGDFKTTWMGRQPVIVSRGADDGQIRVFFNRCRHRGSQLCQSEQGHANFFRCAYHGWTYSNTGKLVGVPFDDRYGNDFAKEELGLIPVPRVATCSGFIFASLAPTGPDLDEYLGAAKPYLQYIGAGRGEGVELSVGSNRGSIDANWKLQVENTIDSYHFGFLHQGYLKILQRRDQEVDYIKNATGNEAWRTVDLGNGHTAHERGWSFDDPNAGASLGVGELPFSLVIFPNLGFVGSHLRLVHPRLVNKTAVRSYPLLPTDADSETRENVLRSHEFFYGSMGIGWTDDVEVGFDRVELGVSANAHDDDWMIMSRGLGREQIDEHGLRYGRPTDEIPQRSFYGQWRRKLVE